MSVRRTCPTCGYGHAYASDAIANIHFTRHSCEKYLRRAASARRRAARAAGGPRRDCQHPGQPHRHGTRTAYVKDECRCRDCMDANTAASHTASREKTFGRWQPYIDAIPVREHIAVLRVSGVGLTQIAKLANTSLSHVRALVSTEPDGQPTTVRVRPSTADRILAIEATTASSAPGARVDSTGTRRRLQALMAIGWPLPVIAAQLGRTGANLARSMDRASINADTARQIADLYECIWDKVPPQMAAAQRSATDETRSHARQQGWLPPLGWDDIDNDPDPTPPAPGVEDIDERASPYRCSNARKVSSLLARAGRVVRRRGCRASYVVREDGSCGRSAAGWRRRRRSGWGLPRPLALGAGGTAGRAAARCGG